jgi:hypothetical protein
MSICDDVAGIQCKTGTEHLRFGANDLKDGVDFSCCPRPCRVQEPLRSDPKRQIVILRLPHQDGMAAIARRKTTIGACCIKPSSSSLCRFTWLLFIFVSDIRLPSLAASGAVMMIDR